MGIQNVVRWASAEVNYPGSPSTAQPWLGGPVTVAPAADFWSPNFKPPGQNFNFLFAKEDAQAAYAYNLAVSVALDNWSAHTNVTVADPGGVGGTPLNFATFAYDPQYARWVAAVANIHADGILGICQTFDGGRTWSQFTGTLFANKAIAFAILPSVYLVVDDNNGAGWLAHAFANPAGTETRTARINIFTVANALVLGASFYVYGVKQTGGTYTGYLESSPDGIAWTDQSATLAAAASNFAAGTDHVGALLSAVGMVGGTQVAAFVIAGATAGTDTARLMSVTIIAGAPSPVEITPAFFATHRKVTGITYSPNEGLWGIAVFDGSGTSYIYTSPDLLTWTQVFTTAIGQINGLAVVGDVWATTLSSGVTTQLWISGNVGSLGAGSTWSATTSTIAVTSDGLGGLFSNGNQMVAASDTDVAISLQVGFIKDAPAAVFASPFANQGSGNRSVLIYANVDGVMPNAQNDFAVGFDSLSGNHAVTLPANPAIGQEISVTDLDGSLAAHNFTIDGNGNNINGAAAYVLSNVQGPHASVTLIYFGATGWAIT